MWVVLVTIGLGTYALRLSMLVLLAGRRSQRRTGRSIELVAPAALAALVSTMLAPGAGTVDPVELVAVVAGFVAVRRTNDVLSALWIGLPAFIVLDVAHHYLVR